MEQWVVRRGMESTFENGKKGYGSDEGDACSSTEKKKNLGVEQVHPPLYKALTRDWAGTTINKAVHFYCSENTSVNTVSNPIFTVLKMAKRLVKTTVKV